MDEDKEKNKDKDISETKKKPIAKAKKVIKEKVVKEVKEKAVKSLKTVTKKVTKAKSEDKENISIKNDKENVSIENKNSIKTNTSEEIKINAEIKSEVKPKESTVINVLNDIKEVKELKENTTVETKDAEGNEIKELEDKISEFQEKKFVLDFSKAKNKLFRAKRKRCVCRIVIVENPKIKLINKKDYKESFNSILLIERSTYPIKLIGHDFGFKANIQGGGVSAMSDALKFAIAKSILHICSESKYILRSEKLLTSDHRKVLPKKPGRPKAVKVGQRSKR